MQCFSLFLMLFWSCLKKFFSEYVTEKSNLKKANQTLVPCYYMTMKIGSNQREIRSCLCKQGSYFVSRKQCIKTESPIATRSVATREQWAYLV